MRIRVGPFEYAVELVAGYIHHEGQRCYGLCDNHRQRILLSDLLNRPQRLRVLIHELMHAWMYHFGHDAGDEESLAELVSVAMTELIDQATAGAEATPALERILTGRATPPTDRSGAKPAHRPLRTIGRREPATADGPSHQPSPTPQPDRCLRRDGWRIRIYDPVA